MKHSKEQIDNIEKEGKKIKFELFSKFCEVREGHPGSILSIFDIVNALYLSDTIKLQKESNNNDTFIMSKGHAASVQYPYLLRKGLISRSDWDNWGKSGDSNLRVFGNNSIGGIDVTSGSLGHGVGIAAGMALANRYDKINYNNFVIISEGELYEGSTWEALLFVAHHKLTNVKIVLDVNRNMILGRPEDNLNLESFDDKFQAFNFETLRINGHDYNQIFSGLDFLMDSNEIPKILIADTVKGKGVSFMEDQPESHYWGDMNDNKMKQMLKELAV